MARKIIVPARTASGPVVLPGDKSISHRYALLAALANGVSKIDNFSPAADCQSTLDCLKRLGIRIEISKAGVRICGADLNRLKRSRRELDAQNSGTTMRMLAGILAGQAFDSTITGDASLRRRPMGRVIEPLKLMGAEIAARDGGVAPLKIHGQRLHGIDYALPVPSAQVKSAILLAGLFAEGTTSVAEPIRTRDHTELALEEFGVRVEYSNRTIRVRGGTELRPRNLVVPGDLSSGVFFLAAALILPDSNLVLHDAGVNPTRAAVLDVLAGWGATISLLSVREVAGELVGDIAIRHSLLEGGVIEGDQVAQLIDELPMLAALGPYTERGVEIRDARELRVKESDRIAVVAENLRRMGAQVEERPDGLRVGGKSAGKLHGAEIDPAGDHRIAMAFAVAALGAEGKSTIRGSESAAVSFPGFFEALEKVVER
ncbi:MAG TPA: 3-phosphoshikimate 1-carboxyvinyltransferase [Candidatus Limnocylindrales bacterium]|nr:3-phosphoshikimate 1-carboxyvinyltransferase [Candidatus Limnocylindrales bacterium]